MIKNNVSKTYDCSSISNLPEPMIIPRMIAVPSSRPSSLRILTPSSFWATSPSGLTADWGNNGRQVGGKGLPSSFIFLVYDTASKKYMLLNCWMNSEKFETLFRGTPRTNGDCLSQNTRWFQVAKDPKTCLNRGISECIFRNCDLNMTAYRRKN